MEFQRAYTRKSVAFDQSIPDPVTGEIQTSMTKQHFKDEVDINNILAKFQKTGLIDHVKKNSSYINLPNALEYHDAMNLTIEAQASFDGLPSSIRKEFQNDPQIFLAFVADPKNVDRMRTLGILNPLPDAKKSDAEPELPLKADDAKKADE